MSFSKMDDHDHLFQGHGVYLKYAHFHYILNKYWSHCALTYTMDVYQEFGANNDQI